MKPLSVLMVLVVCTSALIATPCHGDWKTDQCDENLKAAMLEFLQFESREAFIAQLRLDLDAFRKSSSDQNRVDEEGVSFPINGFAIQLDGHRDQQIIEELTSLLLDSNVHDISVSHYYFLLSKAADEEATRETTALWERCRSQRDCWIESNSDGRYITLTIRWNPSGGVASPVVRDVPTHSNGKPLSGRLFFRDQESIPSGIWPQIFERSDPSQPFTYQMFTTQGVYTATARGFVPFAPRRVLDTDPTRISITLDNSTSYRVSKPSVEGIQFGATQNQRPDQPESLFLLVGGASAVKFDGQPATTHGVGGKAAGMHWTSVLPEGALHQVSLRLGESFEAETDAGFVTVRLTKFPAMQRVRDRAMYVAGTAKFEATIVTKE